MCYVPAQDDINLRLVRRWLFFRFSSDSSIVILYQTTQKQMSNLKYNLHKFSSIYLHMTWERVINLHRFSSISQVDWLTSVSPPQVVKFWLPQLGHSVILPSQRSIGFRWIFLMMWRTFLAEIDNFIHADGDYLFILDVDTDFSCELFGWRGDIVT